MPQEIANKFLLCCLLDWQMDSNVAWRNGERLVHEFGDPDDIWWAITSVPDNEWKSKRDAFKLHRFPAGHNGLWRIGKLIIDLYHGDARSIWEGQSAAVTLGRLWELGAGDQISRMVTGALFDCGQVRGPSDVKADVYVCRVLARAVHGDEKINPEAAVKLTRKLHTDDPWQLDGPLWHVGKSFCHARIPNCSGCYLAPHCAYALGHSTATA
jgi:hypothetical protein